MSLYTVQAVFTQDLHVAMNRSSTHSLLPTLLRGSCPRSDHRTGVTKKAWHPTFKRKLFFFGIWRQTIVIATLQVIVLPIAACPHRRLKTQISPSYVFSKLVFENLALKAQVCMGEMGYLWSFLHALFCSTLLQQKWLSHHSPKTSTLDTMLLRVHISVYRAPTEMSKLLCHRMKRWTRDHTDSDRKRGSSWRNLTPENGSEQETWNRTKTWEVSAP